MKNFENPAFLKKKYDLHNTPEVELSAKRTEKRTGEKVPSDPEARIQNYLDRLERLVFDSGKEQKNKNIGTDSRPRALSLLREMVMEKYVRANKEKMAVGAARVEERAARELGVEAHYGEQELDQRGEIAIVDLEKSLDNWISYLSDANESYPTWFRYYAFRNILGLGDYDKDKDEFTKRSQGSTRLFPEIDRGALAYVQQMIEANSNPEMLEKLQKAQREAALNNIPSDQLITNEKVEQFSKMPFAKQYIEGIRQKGEITAEMREKIRGKWVKYQQGTDPTALWASLQNKGTAWCTKGFATAETQLKAGDFYVYYTLNKQGKPRIPRIAIRMEGQDKISNDVRGVLDSQQNIEGNMMPFLDEKLTEFGPEADRFKKRSSDMKQVTEIENKTKAGEQLTKNELTFLYEIDSKIDGFGYQSDPRIKELKDQRDKNADMLIIFDCAPNQIIHNQIELEKALKSEIEVKAYLGELFPNIFKLLPSDLEYIYTEFPESRVKQKTIELGTGLKTRDDFLTALEQQNNYISDFSKDIMSKPEFIVAPKETKEKLIILSVSDLGFSQGATIKDIYLKAQELGLELCPPETGPQLRLQYTDQPTNEYYLIGMKPISDSSGLPRLFDVNCHDGGSWLSTSHGKSVNFYDSRSQFVFSSSK